MKPKPRVLWTLWRIWLVWRHCPELRLGQLISNTALDPCTDLYYIQDEVLVERLDRYHAHRDDPNY